MSEFLVRESACFHLLIFEKMSYFFFYCLFFYDNMSVGSLKTTIVVKSQRALSALRDNINQIAAK